MLLLLLHWQTPLVSNDDDDDDDDDKDDDREEANDIEGCNDVAGGLPRLSSRCETRVYTAQLGCFSHSLSATQSSSLPLSFSLSLPLSSYETQTACSDSPSDGYEIRAPDLMDHFFLLDPTLPSRRPSLFLSSFLPLFLLSEYLAHPRDSPLSFYLPIFRRQIFARAESDFRAPSWPMTTVRPRARHTSHFSSPLLPNSASPPPSRSLSLARVLRTYVQPSLARARAHTRTHIYIYIHTSAARKYTQRESVPLRRR